MRTMKSKSLVQGTAVWIAALCLSLLMLAAGCNFRDDTSKPEKDFAKSSLIAAIGGSGSTFISPLMTVWINDYQKLHPDIQINYRSIGSGSGVDEFRKQWTQFAASDAPLTDDQVGEISHTVQIPVTAGPVCIIYNLPELKTSLRLSSNTLAGIYLGKIVNWRDPAIEKDNPGVKLPQLPVIVVHRSDRSGTTSIFTDYLTRISPGWARRAGQGLTVTWAVGLSGEGTKQVVNLVKQTLGTHR